MIELNSENYLSKNFVSEKEIFEIVKTLKNQGKKIGLCTGSFDLLHPGHITHLTSAKNFCDVLIVAIARDKYSSNKYLGSGRPIFSDNIRAFIISKLKPVDFVFLEEGTPEIVEVVKPDFYIKGIDYSNEKDPTIAIQKEMLKLWGGKVIFTKDEKFSTTDIINHIKEEII